MDDHDDDGEKVAAMTAALLLHWWVRDGGRRNHGGGGIRSGGVNVLGSRHARIRAGHRHRWLPASRRTRHTALSSIAMIALGNSRSAVNAIGDGGPRKSEIRGRQARLKTEPWLLLIQSPLVLCHTTSELRVCVDLRRVGVISVVLRVGCRQCRWLRWRSDRSHRSQQVRLR